MSKAPIDYMLDGLDWKVVENPQAGDLPHVTHHGVLNVFDTDLRCYRLSDGMAVFDADDFERMLKTMFDTGTD